MERSYDKAYFDRWYRSPQRVSTRAALVRKATLAVAMAEYYLERPIRTVLDVGCGEGQWQPVLNRLRPGVRYTGIDPSAYAIRRFGRRRHLLEGSFGNLPRLRASYDLLICSDSLYYVPDDELLIGLQILVEHLDGVAFLEAYPASTDLSGDTEGMHPRSAAHYRKIFRHAGLVPCGSHGYVSPSLRGCVTELERGG